MRAPTLLLGLLLVPRPRRSGLVEKDQHRFSEPIEDLHFRRDITCVGRVFRRVDEIEDDVGLIAHVLPRLVARPEGAVAPTVPDLGKKPANGIRSLPEPFCETHTIAKAGG